MRLCLRRVRAAMCGLLAMASAPAAAAAGGGPATDVAGPCDGAGTRASPAVALAATQAAAGRHAEALLVLQRALAADPQDCRARVALAEALAAMGAAPGLDDVPGVAPDDRRGWLSRSLAALGGRAWLGLEVGYDSNVNSASAFSGIALPALNFRSVALDPLLVRASSGFAGLSAGAAASRPLAADIRIGAVAQAALRYNAAVPDYVPQGLLAAAALEKTAGRLQWRAEAGGSQRRLGRYSVVERIEGRGELSVEVAPAWRAGMEVVAAGNRYPQYGAVRTADVQLGGRLLHERAGLSLAVAAGRERADGPVKDLDRHYETWALDWAWSPRPRIALLIRLAATRSRYDAPSPLFLAQRVDTWREFSVATRHRLDRHWTLAPRLALEENASSIPLLAFRRKQVIVEFRREW